jgi:hypothetical protein
MSFVLLETKTCLGLQVVTTLYFGIDTGLMAAIFLNIISYVYRSGNTVRVGA